MPTRLMTTLVMVAGLLVSGQALAQPQPPSIPDFQRGQVLTADELNRIVGQVNRNTNASGGSGGATHTVDCDAGETITSKMAQAQPGDTIMIAGTCNEPVVVDKDGITLDGGGTAVIDGSGADAPVISVNGHQNVIIKGLTVQNGLHGIRLADSAVAWLEDVIAQGSRFKSGYDSGAGIVVYTSSTVALTGAVVANDNAGNGIGADTGGSVVALGNFVVEGNRLPPVRFEANGNGGYGISIWANSSFSIFGADTAAFNDNGGSGAHVSSGSSAAFGVGSAAFNNNGGSGVAVFEGSTATLYGGAINGNQGYAGLWVTRGSTVVAYNLTVENNALRGIGVYRSSHLDLYDSHISGGHDRYGIQVHTSIAILQDVTSTGNVGDGVAVHSRSYVELRECSVTDNGGNGVRARNGVHVDMDDSTVTGNATDVLADVLSRIGWENSTVGTMICDDSVLTYYEASCPE